MSARAPPQWAKLGGWIHAHRSACLAASVLLTALAAPHAWNLGLDASFAGMLSRELREVRDFHRIGEKYGSEGFVELLVQAPSYDAGVRFVDALAQALEAHPEIRYTEHRQPLEFFERRAALFASVENLRHSYERLRALFAGAGDVERRDPLLRVKLTLIRLLSERSFSRSTRRTPYFYQEEAGKHVFLLLAKPRGTPTDLGYAGRVLAEVRRVVASVQASAWGEAVSVDYAGYYALMVDAMAGLRDDTRRVSLVATALVLGILLLFLRNVWVVLGLLATLAMGLTWTMAVAELWFGRLNVVSSFLISILLGLGIDYGILITSTYCAVPRQDDSPRRRVEATLARAGGATFVAALTSVASFGVVALFGIRGSLEFGGIAGIGLLLIYAATLFAWIPILVVLDERGLPWVRQPRAFLPARLWRRPGWVLSGAAVLSMAAVAGATRIRFNDDMHHLVHRPGNALDVGASAHNLTRVNSNPTVPQVQSPEEERRVVQAVRASISVHERARTNTIQDVLAMSDFIPERQEEKLEIVRDIARLLAENEDRRQQIERATRRSYDELMTSYQGLQPFGADELPPFIQRKFRGVTGSGPERYVLVFPKAYFMRGTKIFRFREQLRQALADHPTVPVGQTSSSSPTSSRPSTPKGRGSSPARRWSSWRSWCGASGGW